MIENLGPEEAAEIIEAQNVKLREDVKNKEKIHQK